MKPGKLICSALILIAPIAFLALQAKPQPPTVEGEIKEFKQRANAAYEANDLANYRKDWSAYIGEGNRVEKVEISDMHIQVGPGKDAAVASYILHVRTKLKDGKVTDEDNQESDVMFKRNGEWKIVFLHYSSAPKK